MPVDVIRLFVVSFMLDLFCRCTWRPPATVVSSGENVAVFSKATLLVFNCFAATFPTLEASEFKVGSIDTSSCLIV